MTNVYFSTQKRKTLAGMVASIFGDVEVPLPTPPPLTHAQFSLISCEGICVYVYISMCAYVFICVHMYTYVYVRICLFAYIRIHPYICMCIYV